MPLNDHEFGRSPAFYFAMDQLSKGTKCEIPGCGRPAKTVFEARSDGCCLLLCIEHAQMKGAWYRSYGPGRPATTK